MILVVAQNGIALAVGRLVDLRKENPATTGPLQEFDDTFVEVLITSIQ